MLVIVRDEIIAALVARDGDVCQYPGCVEPFDEIEGAAHYRTIDHIFPQATARRLGWTEEQIWDLSNLQLMGKRCNAHKGDRQYNEDGTLPPHPRESLTAFQRRADRSARIEVCDTCASGRLLLEGETCEVCGSGPQPATAPRYLQAEPKNCGHGWGEHPEQHCWMCWIGHVPRRPAMESVLSTDEME